jgi:AraC-like DNA-binding protein
MEADIHHLYASGFYRVMDFRCRCVDCVRSKPEYSDNFSIAFVRRGNFLFNVFRRSLDAHTGCVLMTKPGAERTVTHVHTVPDECTIFQFTADFHTLVADLYAHTPFFGNPDLHSTLVRTSPELEFLHFAIVRRILDGSASRLQLDELVVDMVQKVLREATDYEPSEAIDDRVKRFHLSTIETAKDYIATHYARDISLSEMAAHCHVSPFHFSRLFKIFTRTSPYRFLLAIRLQQACLLLRETVLPVSDVAYASGFNSLEHFTASFTRAQGCSPTAYRGALV